MCINSKVLLQDLIWKFTFLKAGMICSFRYKGTMLDDVPNIFEAVFQCTLEVIKFYGPFLCYPHYRRGTLMEVMYALYTILKLSIFHPFADDN